MTPSIGSTPKNPAGKPLAVVPKATEETGAPEPTDSTTTGASKSDAEFQKMKRLGTNATLVFLGDVPAGLSVAVGLNMLPGLTPLEPVINAFNALTGYIGLASDLSVARDCISNPEAKKIDQIVDAAHIGTDLINTGASMVPLFTSLSNPIAMGVFIGGQAFGAAADVAKSVWDWKRGGTQSSRSDSDQPHRLVLDNFEKKMGRLPFLLGTLAANSMAFSGNGAGHIISAALAQPLTAVGGAFGGVYGFTQVKKSRQLLKKLKDIKAQGIEDFDMPRWSRNNVKHFNVHVDTAIAQVKRKELAGWGQLTGSALLMAAGCSGFAPLAVAGLLVSTAVGVAAVGTELVVNRKKIKEDLVVGAQLAKEKVKQLKDKVGNWLEGPFSVSKDDGVAKD